MEDAELIDALLEVKRQGKTRWIGMSSDMPQLPPLAAFEELDVFQVGYQPMQRESEDWIRQLGDDGRGIIIRSRAAKGQPHYEGTLAYNQGRIASGPGTWVNFERAKLDELRDDGDSRIAFMLRYTISLPQAHTVVVGTLAWSTWRRTPGGPARAAVGGHAVGGEPAAGGAGLHGGVVDSGWWIVGEGFAGLV